MKKWYLIFFLMLTFVSQGFVVHAKKCTGSPSCTACTNCSRCKYCSQQGGSCGACSGNSQRSNSSTQSNSLYNNNSSHYESSEHKKENRRKRNNRNNSVVNQSTNDPIIQSPVQSSVISPTEECSCGGWKFAFFFLLTIVIINWFSKRNN